jgi:hypothetical protein
MAEPVRPEPQSTKLLAPVTGDAVAMGVGVIGARKVL